MDARMAKRVAQIEHIKQKPYYGSACDREEPDPTLSSISTRMWKYTMRTWVNALKTSYVAQKAPAAAVSGVMGGS